MKRLCLCLVFFALACFVPAPTQAAPTLSVCVNGLEQCVNLSDFIRTTDGKTYVFNIENLTLPGEVATLTSLSGVYNSDPFITFTASTTNLVAGPTTFAFLFGTPIVPSLYNVATSTGGVSVTNGVSGTTTVATSFIYPSYISGYGTLGFVPTNLGVDLGTLPCIAGPGAPFTVTNVCGQGSTSNTFFPAFYDNLEALLTYSQNDIASGAAWTGAVTLNFDASLIPEPALLSLFGVAIATLGVRRRLRR